MTLFLPFFKASPSPEERLSLLVVRDDLEQQRLANDALTRQLMTDYYVEEDRLINKDSELIRVLGRSAI